MQKSATKIRDTKSTQHTHTHTHTHKQLGSLLHCKHSVSFTEIEIDVSYIKNFYLFWYTII